MSSRIKLTGIPAMPAALALGATSVALSAGYQRYATRRDMHRFPLSGRLVSIGDIRLHVHVTGTDQAGPTVLFEAGLSCPLDAWAWIQPAVSLTAPAISYDRAGLGGSDPRRGPRTAGEMMDDLDALLAAIGAEGPYVLVGHSFGGLLVRTFAARHPAQVAGVVLVDASHPDQIRRSRRQRRGLPTLRSQMQQAATMAWLGFNRITKVNVVTGISGLPPADRARACARMLTPKACRTGVDELTGWLSHVNDEVRGCQLPPDCPLVVLTAGAMTAEDPAHDQFQAELAGLSANSIRQVVPDADHLGIVMDQAYAHHVTDAIVRVVASVQSGSPLAADTSSPDQR